MRQAEHIHAEVKQLQNLKDKVPAKTSFGDDNHAAIEAQIDVLKNPIPTDVIDERYGEIDHLYSAAMVAYEWKFERADAAPHHEWEELVGTTPVVIEADAADQEARVAGKSDSTHAPEDHPSLS